MLQAETTGVLGMLGVVIGGAIAIVGTAVNAHYALTREARQAERQRAWSQEDRDLERMEQRREMLAACIHKTSTFKARLRDVEDDDGRVIGIDVPDDVLAEAQAAAAALLTIDGLPEEVREAAADFLTSSPGSAEYPARQLLSVAVGV